MQKKSLIFLISIVFLASACSKKWTSVINYGSITESEFSENVEFEIRSGLIFVPVKIHGKTYRFLFDSGAPLSISKKLQNELSFKIISKGHIVDSDKNRSRVNWVSIDSIQIGEISFIKLSAFVGDFEANPLLKCLKIDGILGSNMMRKCNWNIDQENKSLRLFSHLNDTDIVKKPWLPFKTDQQNNIYIDLKIGSASLQNVLVDYGSNGSVSLRKEIFNTLEDLDKFGEIYHEKGLKQSGVVGKAVELDRKISFTDSIIFDSTRLNRIRIKTGEKTAIGNKLLSQFNVTIDWQNKRLIMEAREELSASDKYMGFNLGYSEEKGVYIQSIIENSIAFQKGLRPEMKVLQLDDMDFENEASFCDLIDYEYADEIFLKLIDLNESELKIHIKKTTY